MVRLFFLLFIPVWLSQDRVKVVDLAQLKAAAERQTNDTLYVVNFWATWCKPCVAEMPYFRKAQQTYGAQAVKVIFVSLNSAKEKSQVEKFVTDNQVREDVLLLSAGNPNNWIDSIEPSWSGAIPATAMYKQGSKVFFYEGEFTQQQLDSVIQTKIQ